MVSTSFADAIKSLLKGFEGEVVVVGHKAPDTDAVISSIATSYLLNSLGIKARAYVAGPLQPETRVIIEKVGIEVPELITDVRVRARDVMRSDVPLLKLNDPLKDAVDAVVSGVTDAVPVIDSDGRVYGLFTIESYATHSMSELMSMRLTLKDVPVSNFIKVSKASIIVGDPNSLLNGRVYVAAWGSESIRSRSKELRGQIVVVGDREDVQLVAIESGVSALIVTGGYGVSDSVKEEAMKSGVTILSSPHDTYTTLRLLDLSRPIKYFVNKAPSVHEEALLDEVRDVMVSEGVRAVVVTDALGRFLGLISRSDLVKDCSKRVVMVDHNEFSQSVDGIEEATVVAVIDHHRVGGDVTSLNPILFRVEPLGSTSTIVWRLAKELGIELPRELCEAMMYAILSDTMLLKSPTTTEVDRSVINELSEASSTSLESALEFMRIAMAANEPTDPKEIVTRDLKVFSVRDVRFGIAQIFTSRPQNYLAMLNRIKEVMKSVMSERGLKFLALMITDYIDGNTYLVVEGDSRPIEEGLGTDLSKGHALLKGITSRKGQVLPKILKQLSTRT